MDIISYNLAQKALRKAGFIGTKSVDDTGVKNEDIVRYSEELDKFIVTELRTKVNQWEQGHYYEKNEIVVFDDILHWVLKDHKSHSSNIDFDIADGKIMPFVIEAGIANVLALDFKIQDNGNSILITWVNPTSPTYEGREVYISDTVDITTMRYHECVEAVANDQAQLVTSGLGTGEGSEDSYLLTAETRKHYYIKAFVEHFEDDGVKHSSGRFLAIGNPDATPPAPPMNLVTAIVDNGVKLEWTQPADSDFFHTKIIRSTVRIPESPVDGTVVAVVSGDGVYIDTTVQEDIEYFYKLFSYDDAGNGYQHGIEGNWNEDKSSEAQVTVHSIYGFNIHTGERLRSAVGKTQEDFDNIYPWSEIARAVVDNTGAVLYYLDDEDSSLKDDGIEEAILDGSDGNVVVEYPEFYYLKENGECYISRDMFPNATLMPRTIVGAFEASETQTGELQSVANVIPVKGRSITEYRLMSSNIGNGWQQKDIEFLSVLKDLFLIEYAERNSQLAIGEGIVNDLEMKETGGTVSLGNRSGVGVNGSVSYRGLENPWGNNWEFLEGFVVTDTAYYTAKTDFGSFISDGNTGTYQPIPNVVPITEDGFISSVDNTKHYIGKDVLGNSFDFVGDYQYSHKQGEINVAVHGGNYQDSNKAGLFRLHMGVKPFGKEDEMEFRYEFKDYTGNQMEKTYEATGALEQQIEVGGAMGYVYSITIPKQLSDEDIISWNNIEIL